MALFYYVLHLYVIHAAVSVAVVAGGFPFRTMIFPGSQNVPSPLLQGSFGFSLGQTWAIWAGIVVLLYLPCAWWNSFKDSHKSKWWVSYV